MSGSRRHGCLYSLWSRCRGAGVKRRIQEGKRNRGGGRCARGKARGVGDERAVYLLGIGAGLEIARGRVVGFHALARDPRQTRVRRYRRVRLVQVGVDGRIAGEAEYRGAVGEEVDVLRADDMHALRRGFLFGSAY